MEHRYEREHWDRRDGRERDRPSFDRGYPREQDARGFRRDGERLIDERRFGERGGALEPSSHRRDEDRRRAAIRAYDPGEYGAYGNAARDERGGRGFAPEGDEDLGVFSGYGASGSYGGQDGEDDHPGYGREEQRRYSESRGSRFAGRERGDFREGRFGGALERRFGDAGELRVSSRGDAPRGGRGAHFGRGPREYQRSDERIREDACDRLTDSGEVDASNLSVQVSNGEITIEGEVPSRRMKRAAEDCVDDISGVKQVHNRLRVVGSNDPSATTLL